MKYRWLVMSLVLILLWGCDAPGEPETLPATEPEGTVVATDPTVPSGLYEPGSEPELITSGALQAFPLPFEAVWDIRFLGGDILVFSGSDQTTLTLLSGAERYISARTTLSCRISPDDPSVVITDHSITFYDSFHHALITLDEDLLETRRIPLPESLSGSIVLSPDCRSLYYCTDEGLRVLNPENSYDQLLVRMNFPLQEVTGIHCGGSVLECSISDMDGIFLTRFLSAEDGSLLYEATSCLTLRTEDDFYFAVRDYGFVSELIAGSKSFGPSLLYTGQHDPQVLPVLGSHSAVLVTGDGASTQLDYYNLDSGFRRYHLCIPGSPEFKTAAAGAPGDIWLLCYDPEIGAHILYRWMPSELLDGEESHLLPLTCQNRPIPEEYRQQAEAIREKYGIRVLLREDAAAAAPWDYELIPEDRIAFVSYQLSELDRVLSWYPEGFMEKLASGISGGEITICLVREIRGIPGTGALDSATGIQYWGSDAGAYLAIASHQNMARNICHELFHVIESRVFSDSCLYDDWSRMNPEGFTYDFDYLQHLSHSTAELVTGENRAFVDLYSMSFPKEDRARIMEYAMMPGQQELFSSPILQQKLRVLCLGIREAFGLNKYTEPLLWEQYLAEPLGKNA